MYLDTHPPMISYDDTKEYQSHSVKLNDCQNGPSF